MNVLRSRTGLIVAVSLLAVVGFIVAQRESRDELLEKGQRAIIRQQPELAAQIGERLLASSANDPQALLLAAAAAEQMRSHSKAVELLKQVATDNEAAYIEANCEIGRLAIDRLGLISVAEQSFRNVLTVNPAHVTAIDQLAYILSLQTRTNEANRLQLTLIGQGAVTPEYVFSLVQNDLLYPDLRFVKQLQEQEPNHPGLLLAEARIATLKQNFDRARSLLEQAIRVKPDFIEAHARLGKLLLDHSNIDDLPDWLAELPQSSEWNADLWIVVGQIHASNGNTKAAMRCYWEAGNIEAASLPANYLLGGQLTSLGRQNEAAVLLKRARMLEEYRKLFDHGSTPESSIQLTSELLKQAHELAESLGLLREAFAFSQLAASMQPAPEWATRAVTDLHPRLAKLPLARTAPQANIFQQIAIPESDLPEINLTNTPPHLESDPSQSAARFENLTQQLRIDFSFDNGVDHRISGAQRPYDFTGGGIAAFDIDADSWPDLYFSQGCVIDDDTGNPISGQPDQLFRNRIGTQFTNDSLVSAPETLDYSQGVAAGDINNDGFTDLLVGNLGGNRLLRNNGDGTFSDVSSQVAGDGARWTTSCVVCDVNGDQWPDLYTVNYLSGDITSRVCRDETGRKHPCAPQTFEAAQDQLFLGDGNGNFVDATARSGIQIENGKGLGVVVANLTNCGELDIFVANDGVPNFLFMKTKEHGDALFNEVGGQRGLAVNGDGQSEACMGIAVEDFNLDRRSDIFVTNFLDESNTLYSETNQDGFYLDQTWSSGLGPPSLPVLGFGVQAVDGDLDGLPDLVVVNGHVDDFTDRGTPYHMSPQYFTNIAGMRFTEQSAESVGEYFSGKHLGRCVTRMDWDQDGAEEVVIGTLDHATSILHNATSPRGGSVSLSLIGTTSQRDAFGTTVSLTTRQRTITRQLVAGDGYLASNERKLVFGLGSHTNATNVSVKWAGGKEQQFPEVVAGTRYAAVEGRALFYAIPR
ncbi:FG-GAP-like repeat-containing protein [Fuerstiella marisgermanici]|uniref:Putative PEP-CTERM system TPR-repeat lipoprotein n=1 Tax=Fuerstiella marisgermanici TaxID=1891926 RepID=A0A1P8WNP6_9PLAN|nr:FG-GAP-like repeat-containing protein [Fuerstiella marisgermanici]APZ95668.1 putative PEP-CTERM system TPR-repeat lipoprotein [Fuerstiella marisgermanici]